ncbi:hypothetical protein SAMN04489762_3451 [Terribacillus saccharophilus]|uniref:Uncharacterized protein n=1 Tax=Terribacillus saccharophilus TaxID=361277 RepID=A0AAX2EJT1_9BACI|nr:hypothetical protein SAMN04489762_3451 [Terribacillus saccharophilus]
MLDKYIGLKTVSVGILVNFASDAIKMVVPAQG